MRNRYKGNCLCCGKDVPVQAGHFERFAGMSRVRCDACTRVRRPKKLEDIQCSGCVDSYWRDLHADELREQVAHLSNRKRKKFMAGNRLSPGGQKL